MKFPSIEQYGEAMQFPENTILDQKLRKGRVQTDSLGLPWGRSGAFALTFKISSQGANYAFRCFQSQRDSMHQRYESISEFLSNNKIGGFVNFRYLDEGIKIQKANYPAVIMDWASGQSLGSYIEDNLNDQSKLAELQENLEKLAIDLENAGIAHGDIQSQNILVDTTGQLALVDYDGMFVPTLAKLKAIESGHRNFQHPQREKILPFDETLDRFPFALLHTSIGALIENPKLWDEFQCHPEKILFSSQDLQTPSTSKIFKKLARIPSLRDRSAQIASFSQARYDQTPKFTEYLEGKQPQVSARTNQKADATSQPWYMNPDAPIQADQPSTHIGDLVVIDARKTDDVTNHGGQAVQLVGKIFSVDLSNSGKKMPHAILILTSSTDLRVEVAIWAEGLKSFAQSGITVDESWTGSWIAVEGELSAKLGSSNGPFARLTLTNAKQLERVTHQRATSILKSQTRLRSSESNSKQQTINRNENLISSLGSKGGKGSKATPFAGKVNISKSSKSSVPSSTNQTSNQSNDSFFSSWGLVIALVALAVAIILVFIISSTQGGIGSRGQSADSKDVEAIAATKTERFTKFFSEYNEQCLTGDTSTVDCSSPAAELRVIEVLPLGNVSCDELVGGPRTEKIFLSGGLLCTTPIERGSGKTISFETCTEATFSDGVVRKCFPREGWSYLGCWEAGQGAFLQQRIGGRWQTVKTDFAVKDGCDSGFPWTLRFARKASGAGVKQYRIVVPAMENSSEQVQTIKVTVKEV